MEHNQISLDVPDSAARNPLRPALIVSEQTVSKYSILLEHLLAGLAEQSISTALVCPPGYDVDSAVTFQVQVIRHPAVQLPLMGESNKKKTIEQLQRFGPNVLHCLSENQARFTRDLARQMHLPYVITVNSLLNRRMALPVSPQHCARITVPAQSIADRLAVIYPAYAKRIVQVNIGTFARDGRKCFSEPGRLVGIITAHPVDRAAEFEKLLGAIRHLHLDGYEFMLFIIGGGRAERQLRRLLAAQGLRRVVTIVPKLGRWQSVLAAGDIFLQPQPSLGFDPVLLEAMSLGSAIAGCKGGVDDLIIDGKTAAAFDPTDELSIYATLQQLFNQREFARTLAQAAQDYSREHHTVSAMVAAMVETYYRARQWFKQQAALQPSSP